MGKQDQSNITKFQYFIGFSKGEFIIAILILSGLILGSIIKLADSEESGRAKDESNMSRLLDSLAEAGRSTYIGTDLEGHVDTALKKKDTMVRKKSYFFAKKKKAMPTKKININTASLAQLVKLPGVGRKTAEKIIAHRMHSPFKTPEDIMKVKGIGNKKFAKMKEAISVK